jgi:hypothetical protein
MSEDEMLAVMISRGHCPDCTQRGFVIGPQGGSAINIECANLGCRSRFNASFYAGNVLLVQRIDRSAIWPSEPT